jgi:hypothetical protein
MTSFIALNALSTLNIKHIDPAHCADPVTGSAVARLTFKKNSKVHSA